MTQQRLNPRDQVRDLHGVTATISEPLGLPVREGCNPVVVNILGIAARHLPLEAQACLTQILPGECVITPLRFVPFPG
jgi:hypothetical protein